MSEIRQYLYNLQTGKTIAQQKPETKDLDKIGDDGGDYSHINLYGNPDFKWAVLRSCAEEEGIFTKLGGDNYADYGYGTVEDLDFYQIINLFMRGDMITSELERGLKAKGATNIVTTEEGDLTVVTFLLNGKNYTIQCVTDAAKSQVDDIQAIVNTHSIQVNNNGTDKAWTEQELYNMGFTSEMYLQKFFDTNQDGTYSLKSPCHYCEIIITSVEDLKSILNLKSFDEYIEDTYINRNATTNVDIKYLIGFKINREWNYDNLKFYINEYLDGSLNPISGNVYADFFGKLAIKNGWATTKNPTNEDIESMITKCIEEIAKQNGVSPNDVKTADFIKYMYNNSEKCASYIYSQFETGNFPTYNYNLTHINLDDFRNAFGNSEWHDAAGTDMPDALANFIIRLEQPEFLNTPELKAIYAAAGITDSDGIDAKLDKMRALITTITDKRNNGNLQDLWYCLEEYLVVNGFIKEPCYTKDELTKMGIGDTGFVTYFYADEAEDGSVVYKPKSEWMSLENILYDIERKKTEAEQKAEQEAVKNQLIEEYETEVYALPPRLEIKSYTDLQKELEKFAKDHNLKKVENLVDVYQDEDGIYYYLKADGEGFFIATSDYDNSKYKSELKCGYGMYNGDYSLQTYLLSQLGAINYTEVKEIYPSTDPLTGEPSSYEVDKTYCSTIYYQTKDGKWHKISGSGTMSIDDWKRYSFEKFLELNKSRHWCEITDVTEEEVQKAIQESRQEIPTPPTLPSEPPVVEIDNEVSISEEEELFNELREILILQNFLNYNIIPNQRNNVEGLDLDEYGNAISIDDNLEYWQKLLAGVTKEDLIQKVLEKLFETSQYMILSDIPASSNASVWPLTIIEAMGGKVIKTHETAGQHYDDEPFTVTFELNGHTYTLPFATRCAPINPSATYNPDNWYTPTDLINIEEKLREAGFDDEELINRLMSSFKAARAIDNNVSDYYCNPNIMEGAFEIYYINQNHGNESDCKEAMRKFREILKNYLEERNNSARGNTRTGDGTTPPPVDNNEGDGTTPPVAGNDENDYYANLDNEIAAIAAELGYEKNDDGNYYYCEGNNTYICVWNSWTNKFDKYLIATEDPDNVELEPNEDGGFNASTPTLDSYLAESLITAKEEGFVPTEETGVFSRNNERYVYDITTHTFIKETDAVQNKTKTWLQSYLDACKLARTLGYKPSSIAFCIFEDSEGNKFKYDTKEEKFVEYKY